MIETLWLTYNIGTVVFGILLTVAMVADEKAQDSIGNHPYRVIFINLVIITLWPLMLLAAAAATVVTMATWIYRHL